MKKTALHGWRLPPGKICMPYKTMKNTKITEPS